LEHDSSWWRETAHRLLFERQDQAAVEPLKKLLRESGPGVARLHALWSLAGLGPLHDADVAIAPADAERSVGRHGVVIAEQFLTNSPALAEKVLALANDAAVTVRFQVAFTLGQLEDPRATERLAAIARRDAADRWLRAAVLSSANQRA